MNTRRCIPYKSKTNKNHFPKNSLGFFEKLDLSKIIFNAVGGSSNRTILVERFSKRMTSLVLMILHEVS